MNLVEILKKCPKGIELYSVIHGVVIFDFVDESKLYPIHCTIKNTGGEEVFTLDGRYINNYWGECVLFPSKDNRDWSTFIIPVELKVGDHIKYLSRDIIGNKIYKIGIVEQCFNANALVDCLNNTHINHSKESLIKIDKFDDSLLHPGGYVLCRQDHSASRWTLCSFSHIEDDDYVASALHWCYCIPYNQETAFLLNTRAEVPKFYQK